MRRADRTIGKRILSFLWLLMTGGLVALAVLYGKKVNVAVMALLVAGQLILWGRSHGEKRKAALSFFAVLLAAFMIVLYRPAYFYELVYRAEGTVFRVIRLFSGETGSLTENGELSRGNNHRTGAVQLEVMLSEKPAQAIYLRGFSGGGYRGNYWEEADDEALFEETGQILGWEEWSSMISGMHQNMQFMLNRDTFREERPSVRTIQIRHRNGDYERSFVPYYSMRALSSEKGEETEAEGYEYQYYEQKDVQFSWDDEAVNLGVAREWYHEMQEAYIQAAGSVNTQVPEHLVPGLVQMAEENPQRSFDEITEFIRNTLETQVSYTLTPGRTPVNEDIVEYFLFENRQGYCQQFASAATLLYRLYGVPARYASGYLLQPEDFERQEDETWRAEVTDASAHAWTEVLLGDYGWVPMEMTPSASGHIPASEWSIADAEWEQIVDPVEISERFLGSEEGYSVFLDLKRYREFYPEVGIVLICGLLFLPIFLEYRRLRRRQKLWGMNCREIFSIMMETFHNAGFFTDMEGWEEDFPRRVSEEFTRISEEELRRMQDIVKEAAYSQRMPEEKDEQFVRWIYFRLSDAICRRMRMK